MVKKKKIGNNYVTKKSGSKNTSVRRVKKSTRGQRMLRKDIFSWWSTIMQFLHRFYWTSEFLMNKKVKNKNKKNNKKNK